MKTRKLLLGALLVVSLTLIGIGVFQLLQDWQDTRPAVVMVEDRSELAGDQDDFPRMSVEALHAQLQGENPPLVWELRVPERYAQAHLPGSVLVLESEVEAAAEGLDRSQSIVTLCA